MEKKGLEIVIIGLLMLGLGLRHAQVNSCDTGPAFCMIMCMLHSDHDPATLPEYCRAACNCPSVSLLHPKSGLGLQQLSSCTPAQDICIFQCVLNEPNPDNCDKICGCSLVGLLHSKSGDDLCRLRCSSKCNEASKFDNSEHVKERCNDVCYSLCAKGIDITATAA